MVVLAGAFLYLGGLGLLYYCEYQPQEGDVVFQSLPHGKLVDAIEGITESPFSHCGVVVKDKSGNWMVLESIIKVRETPLWLWMIRGRFGGVAIYRLDSKYQSKIPAFIDAMRGYLNYPYDYHFEMSDEAIYCSELPYKGFKTATGEELGKLERLGDLNWKPNQDFIKGMENGKVPFDRLMITPVSLSKAPQLHEIFRAGI